MGSGSGSYTGSTDVQTDSGGSYSSDSSLSRGDLTVTVTNNNTGGSKTAGDGSSPSRRPRIVTNL